MIEDIDVLYKMSGCPTSSQSIRTNIQTIVLVTSFNHNVTEISPTTLPATASGMPSDVGPSGTWALSIPEYLTLADLSWLGAEQLKNELTKTNVTFDPLTTKGRAAGNLGFAHTSTPA
jgi:hypothetical protein